MLTRVGYTICVNEPGYLPHMQDEVIVYETVGEAKRAWWAEYRSYADEGYEVIAISGGEYAELADPDTDRRVVIVRDTVELVA